MSVGAVNKQTGDRIPTAGMPAVDSVLSGSSTNPVQNRVVKAALDDKADTDMVAADFNAGTSYTAGNYCIYEGKLYKFKNNHSGAWSAADVDEVKITGELSSLKSGLTNIVKTVTETIRTNGNNWLVFPAGRTILSATIGDYDAVVLTYADQFGYMSRFHFMESTLNPQFEVYDADTDYTVRYSYI